VNIFRQRVVCIDEIIARAFFLAAHKNSFINTRDFLRAEEEKPEIRNQK